MRTIRCYVAGLVLTGLLCVGCTSAPVHRWGDTPMESIVQLRYTDTFGDWAMHTFFVSYHHEEGRWEKWGVSQGKVSDRHGQPGKMTLFGKEVDCWGHVKRSDVSKPSGELLREFRGADAEAIIAVLKKPAAYPDRNVYRYWPGPNSNSYTAWVLRNAKASWDPHPRAFGKDFRGAVIGAGVTTTQTGLQLETPIVGAKVGLRDGVELHLFCATLGVDFWPPAIKLPFWRLGFPE